MVDFPAVIAYLRSIGDRIRDREDGQALVEYALILGLISVLAIGALTLIGTDVKSILDAVESALSDAVP